MAWIATYLLMTLSFVTAGIILIVLMMALACNKKAAKWFMSIMQQAIAESLDEDFATYTEAEEEDVE